MRQELSHTLHSVTTLRKGLNITMLVCPQPCKVSADEVVQSLQSDSESGLTMGEAASRLHTHGSNKFVVDEKDPIILRYFQQFKDPLILLLLGSAIVSVLVGQVLQFAL